MTPTSPGDRLRPLIVGPVLAVQFLTIAPPLVRRPPSAAELGASEAFFPLVGLMLGATVAVVDAWLGELFARQVRDVLLVAVLAIATGALHLDGVVDTFDGLFGGRDRDARLAVMRDPRAGAFGLVAIVCLLLLKLAALGALASEQRVAALVLAPCLGRWAIVQSTWAFAYARPVGLGRAFKDGIRSEHAILAGVCAGAASAILLGAGGLALFGLASAAVWAAGRWMAGRLGGLTGDTYGALCELVEVGVWIALGARPLGASW